MDYKTMYETEQTLHNAWEKRAYQAEAENIRLNKLSERLGGLGRQMEDSYIASRDEVTRLTEVCGKMRDYLNYIDQNLEGNDPAWIGETVVQALALTKPLNESGEEGT